jgi:hypothetical protein
LDTRIIDLIIKLKKKCALKEEGIRVEFDLTPGESAALVAMEKSEVLIYSDLSMRMELFASRVARIAERLIAKEKAIDLIARQDPLDEIEVPLSETALVIGGGIVGIQAAADIADGIVFLAKVKAGERPSFDGKDVVVIGGGNTEMDSAPNRPPVRRAFGECRLQTLRDGNARDPRGNRERETRGHPLRLSHRTDEGDREKTVEEIECVRMELAEADSSGRRRPVPVEEWNT